jgi:hypothetical protein
MCSSWLSVPWPIKSLLLLSSPIDDDCPSCVSSSKLSKTLFQIFHCHLAMSTFWFWPLTLYSLQCTTRKQSFFYWENWSKGTSNHPYPILLRCHFGQVVLDLTILTMRSFWMYFWLAFFTIYFYCFLLVNNILTTTIYDLILNNNNILYITYNILCYVLYYNYHIIIIIMLIN